MLGWTKVKSASKDAGVSERTFRNWLKSGLRHVRLPSGTSLIKYGWIDEYLEKNEVKEDTVGEIVNDVEKKRIEKEIEKLANDMVDVLAKEFVHVAMHPTEAKQIFQELKTLGLVRLFEGKAEARMMLSGRTLLPKLNRPMVIFSNIIFLENRYINYRDSSQDLNKFSS